MATSGQQSRLRIASVATGPWLATFFAALAWFLGPNVVKAAARRS